MSEINHKEFIKSMLEHMSDELDDADIAVRRPLVAYMTGAFEKFCEESREDRLHVFTMDEARISEEMAIILFMGFFSSVELMPLMQMIGMALVEEKNQKQKKCRAAAKLN